LEDIVDSMALSQYLILADERKQPLQFLQIVGLHPEIVRSAVTVAPRASASFSMLSIETLRSARSIEPTYVRWSPARSANSSCERPRAARLARRFCARIFRADDRFNVEMLPRLMTIRLQP